MHILTVCGLGVGSSLIMKMTVEGALKELGVKATVEHWDMGTIKSKQADLIVTTDGFRKDFADRENVIFVTNIVNKEEMKSKLKEFLNL